MAQNCSMKLMLFLISTLFFSSLTLAEYQSIDKLNYQPREYNEERSWNRLEPKFNIDNENYYVDNLRQKPSPNYVRNSIENDYMNMDYDEINNGKSLTSKRAWKILFNDRNRGYGKREQQQGNWNNLRGLWGKRSSWSRLQGTWG
ncbi:hypothetical protein PVAND_001658 [Polypedilum vanderplanki]|uniref:Uncharacterized protein n=1 Tax=Polypedilum vanderplanki TaxID=319348 RepID=A0A9J6BP18_POLVA|nr:hypothetical protein PVAND_001658 [Polypedilum vanderplanki]